MARYSARTEKVIIQFGETGLDKYIQKLEQMRNEARQIYKEELKALEDLEKAGANAAQIKEQKVRVKELKSEYESLVLAVQQSDAEFNTVRDAIFNLDNLGPRALNKLLASVKRFGKQAGSLTDETAEKLRVLEGTVKEVAEALSKGFQQGVVQLTSPIASDASYTELRNIMKQYEQYGRVIAEVADNQEEAYKTMGERATEARIRIGEMDGTLTALNNNADIKRIQEYIRGWQDIANYMGATEEQSKTAQENIRQGEKALYSQYRDVAEAGQSSQAEIQEAIKWLEDYRRRVSGLTSDEMSDLNRAIVTGAQNLQKFNSETKKMTMEDQLKDVSKLSNKALADQRKYWQETLDNAVDTRGVEEAKANLQQINDLIRERSQKEVKDSGLLQYQEGQGMRINELKESIKLLKEYRDTLESTDAGGLIEVDNAIKAMNADLKASEESLSSAKTYMQSLDNNGGIAGKSIDDLEKLKNGLEELRRTIDISGDDGKEEMKKIDKAILDVDKSIRKASMTDKRFAEIIKNPQKVHSLEELQTAYDVLEKEIKKAGITEKEFAEKAETIREVKMQIDELSDSLENQEGGFDKVNKKLQELVTYYISAEAVLGTIGESRDKNLGLSDQMTNVQKVTNMTDKEVRKLVRSLQSLDTRTTTEDLMAFAEQAGKLGIYNKYGLDGMQQFVEIGERINATLGEDIGGAKAIADLAKLNNILGVTRDFGNNVRDALDATGSSILNLGNKSAASYEAIVSYVGRVGAIGSTLDMTVPQLVALGGTLDALKMPAEKGSTALNQILASIQVNSSKLAKAARLSTKELEDLVDEGRTYDALLLILDAMKRGEVTAQDLMDVMGGRSKSSVQIRSVWTLLADNTEMLAENLGHAKEGFDSVGQSQGLVEKGSRDYISTIARQSVMTAEFNKVNSNAAGIVERLKNRWAEFLANSSSVAVWTFLANALNAVVKYLYSTDTVARTLKVAIEALITTFIIARLHVVHYIKALWGAITAMKSLQKVSITNWITLIITAVAYLVVEFVKLREETKMLENAFSEFGAEEQAQINRMNLLFNRLKEVEKATRDANSVTDEKKSLIRQINSEYGEYLGFMLSEANSAETVASAQELLNSKLRESFALRKQNLLLDTLDKKYGEDMSSSLSKAFDYIDDNVATNEDKQKIKNITTSYIEEAVKSGETDDVKILAGLRDKLRSELNYLDSDEFINMFTGVMPDLARNGKITKSIYYGNNLSNYIESLIGYTQDFSSIQESAIYGETINKQKSLDSALKVAENLKKELEKLKEGGITTEELERYVGTLDQIRGGLDYYRENENAKEILKWANRERREYQKLLNDYLGEKVWGKKGTDYTTWKDEDLAKEIERFNNISNAIQEGISLSEAYPEFNAPQGFTEQQIKDWMFEQATQMRNILDERHKNTGARYQWSDDGSGSEKKLKEEYEAAIASLDAYYKERETLIQIAQNNEEITEEEANRRRQSLEMEHLAKRAQLRRNAISQMGSDERQTFEGWWAGIEELDAVNWNKLRSQSAKWGKGYRQKQVLATKKDLSEIAKIVNEHKEKIDKILADANPTKKLVMEFGAAMDSLDMIFGLNEDKRTKDLGNRRLQQLMEWSKNAYQLTVEDLKAAMSDEGHVYHEWFSQLGDETDNTLQAMLIRLRNFADERTETVRRSAKETERIFNTRWEGETMSSGRTRAEEERRIAEQSDQYQSMASLAQQWGFGGDIVTANAELSVINMQVEAKEKYIDALRRELEAKILLSKEREKELETTILQVSPESADAEHSYLHSIIGNDEYSQEEQDAAKARLIELSSLQQQLAEQRQATADMEMQSNVLLMDSETALFELRKEQTEATIALYQRQFENLNAYKDDIAEFALAFGEGIFGSKEDRQDAARALLADLAKTTKNVIQNWLIELTTKKQIDQMKETSDKTYAANKSATEAKSLIEHGQNKIAELQVDAATTSADVNAAIASGSAKETAKQGLIGLAKSALIAAGLNLLLGLALGAINKSKSEVAAATGASSGKLATGMLTYGKGKYPTVYAEGKYTDGTRYWVTGNDGQDYNAKYTDNLQTGIYHGPHMAIFSEKGDEMVIDHNTLAKMPRRAIADILMLKRTGRMSLDYNAITDAANTLSLTRSRSLANTSHRKGIRMYADGNIEDVAESLLSGGNVNQIVQTQADIQTQEALINVINRLTDTLDAGLGVNMYGSRGLKKAQEKDERWSRRNRLR